MGYVNLNQQVCIFVNISRLLYSFFSELPIKVDFKLVSTVFLETIDFSDISDSQYKLTELDSTESFTGTTTIEFEGSKVRQSLWYSST